jgi:hypothetical protein
MEYFELQKLEACLNKEVTLPSGAMLVIGHTPFAESLALNEAVIEELKSISFTSQTEMGTLYKDLFCVGFSSKKIKDALWQCFKRCTYDSGKGALKIDKDTFEPEEARQDYPEVCMEVAKANIVPFVKAHSQKFFLILENLKNSPESKPQVTPS